MAPTWDTFRFWRRHQTVIVEFKSDSTSIRRPVRWAKDLVSFNRALVAAFESEIVPVIAAATGLPEDDVKAFKDPQVICNAIKMKCMSSQTTIVNAKGIQKCETLLVEVQSLHLQNEVDVMTISARVLLNEPTQELPRGPYRVWCPVHTSGQGYLKLDGGPLAKAYQTVVTTGTTDDATHVWIVKEKEIEEEDLYTVRLGAEDGYRLHASKDGTVVATKMQNSSDGILFFLQQMTKVAAPPTYFRFECNSTRNVLMVGAKDTLKTGPSMKDAQRYDTYIDPSYLFVLSYISHPET